MQTLVPGFPDYFYFDRCPPGALKTGAAKTPQLHAAGMFCTLLFTAKDRYGMAFRAKGLLDKRQGYIRGRTISSSRAEMRFARIWATGR